MALNAKRWKRSSLKINIRELISLEQAMRFAKLITYTGPWRRSNAYDLSSYFGILDAHTIAFTKQKVYSFLFS